MPKIVITDSKGLVQERGSGIEINSAGTKAVLKKKITLGVTKNISLDSAFKLPAGATITDVFVVAHDAIRAGNTAGGDALTVGVGTDDPGTNIVAETNLLTQNDVTAVGKASILTAGTKLNAGGAALAFATGAVLYSSTARTVNITVDIVTNDLLVGGSLTIGLEYTII